MNFLSFISGLILGLLGLNKNKIMWILRIVLCFFCSIIFLKISYPNLALWNWKDYINDTMYIDFVSQPFLLKGLFFTIAIYLIYYLVLKLLIKKYISNTIKPIIVKILNFSEGRKYSLNHVKKGITYTCKKAFYFLPPTKRISKLEIDDFNIYQECLKSLVDMIFIFLHIVIVLLFVFDINFLLSLFILFIVFSIMSLLILIIPIISKYENLFKDIFIDELNNALL